MIPSKELTKLSVTTAAVLISLGIGRTAQTAKETYSIRENQPFSTNSASSGPKAEDEAEAEAAVEFARRPFVTVDTSIEPEWLLDVPSSNRHFWMGLTDAERESILKSFIGKSLTYTQENLNEPTEIQAFTPQYTVDLVGENDTTMKRQEPKAHNDASNAYITARQIAESVNNAIFSKISSVLDVKSERACNYTR